MKHTVLGLDLAKNCFHLITLNSQAHVALKKKLNRNQLLRFITQLEPTVIAMEACGSAHYWARQFKSAGHTVQLLPPQHVKGYLRGQKNDYNDALAIAEAAQHGVVRRVAVKTVEQQDEQAFHRMRAQLVAEKTRIINQLRGLLAERGIVLRQGESTVRREVADIMGRQSPELSERFKTLLARQYQCLLAVDDELKWYQQQLVLQARTDVVCKRLCEIPGFGPVVSSAFKSWIGTGKQFRKGRDASAALGLVPRQHSTGGRSNLLGISKRGDSSVRSLLVHGARAVVRRASGKKDQRSQWINRLVARRGFNKAVVALANKMVRTGWVIVARGETYEPSPHLMH